MLISPVNLLLKNAQEWLRQYRWWIIFRESQRQGLGKAWQRGRIQRHILSTPPLSTDRSGRIEVRILTWWRDWMNAIWAIKTFYHFSKVRFPLFIHDGGLANKHIGALRRHFPNAFFVSAKESQDKSICKLKARGNKRCAEYRLRNMTTAKLFDFFLLSQADYVISIDSDIVFFAYPKDLVEIPEEQRINFYNKDVATCYSMSIDEMEAEFGIRPPAQVNSGLSLISRESIVGSFRLIDEWLMHPKMFNNLWETEQTLHALASSRYGIKLLSDDYCVSTSAGLTPNLICKHYPGYFRSLLYDEGMKHLISSGFIKSLESKSRVSLITY